MIKLKDILNEMISEMKSTADLEEKKKKRPGLWANIRAQRAKGEKPARKGSKAFKKAFASAKKINKQTKK